MVFKEIVDMEMNTSIWLCCMEKNSLMEDKRKTRGSTLVKTPRGQ